MAPLSTETPVILHPALEKLSHSCDLIWYMAYIGDKTNYGKRLGPTDWHYTHLFARDYAECTAQEAIALFEQVGAENEFEAAAHIANSKYLMP